MDTHTHNIQIRITAVLSHSLSPLRLWRGISTLSPLHTNFQVVNVQRCEPMFACKLVYMSGVHCHVVPPLQMVVVLLCALQSCVEYSSIVSLF